MAQMNTMSNMGSNEAEHLRTISSATFTSESSGTSVRLVASEEKVVLPGNLMSSQTCAYAYTCVFKLTCNGEIAGAVGLPLVVFGKTGVDALVLLGGVEDLQTPVEQDGDSRGEFEQVELQSRRSHRLENRLH